jgi:hypothetical protein
MKRLRSIAICLAGGLAWNTGVCAENGTLETNPYVVIAARNIFRLNPARTAVADTPPLEPSAKITVNGIMTIFGGLPQVLFKVVAPAAAPTPAEKSYILREGEQQDDIEVRHVNLETRVVTFNNHGVVQEISLGQAPPTTAPTIAAPTPVVPHPGRIRPVRYNGV